MIKDRVRQTVLMHDMITAGDKVITALSGGADSVCLLMILNELAGEMGFSLSAVHVNHCLRGEESDRDEQFCRELCRRLDIPFEAYNVDVNKRVSETGESTEEAARTLRYGVLEDASRRLGGARIATAHNLCDNAETLIFNIARGTGIKGAGGIPFVRGDIIRPLLEISREDIEKYLHKKGQEFVTDRTNLTDDYSRNKIRHNVIPVLREINSGFYRAAARFSACAAEDEDFFSEFLSGLKPEDIPCQHSAVRKRYIAARLKENGLEHGYDRLCELDECIRLRKNTRINISGDIFAVFRKGVMSVEKMAERAFPDICLNIDLENDGEICIPQYDKTVKINRVCNDNSDISQLVNKKLTNNCINCAKIQGVAVIRNKRDGDCIMLRGRDFHVKLKKLFNSMKLSREMRECALVIEDEGGLVWSEYGGASERAALHEGDDPADIAIISVKRSHT
ncbi:MAG: tRNA lysidine(34) synthetase TilS [Huintestinicola sp.]